MMWRRAGKEGEDGLGLSEPGETIGGWGGNGSVGQEGDELVLG
jgi:hypothetical protein